MTERWALVVGDARYEVSTLGRVRNASTGHVLSLGGHTGGYRAVRNIRPEASRLVHRMVAGAFIPNPDSLPCVNHRNGDKKDNRVENLEWCNYSTNAKHAIATGLNSSQGETHHYARLSEQQALRVLALRASGMTLKAIADDVGTTMSNVSSICRGKSWKHLNQAS